jgi:hypothetical protein
MRLHTTRRYALFGLAFATAPPHGLTSPHTITRRLILQKARHHPAPRQKPGNKALTACRHTVSGTLSQPLTGALFTFPSRYWSTIGHRDIFSLTTWSWQIHTELHGLRATRETPKGDAQVSPTGLSPSTVGHPKPFDYPNALSLPAGPAEPAQMLPQPHTRNACRLSHAHGLGSSPFAHHYSGNHNCFLFLRVLRCFTSPRPHRPPYTFRRRRHPTTSARLPHSETPGSKSGCRLPEAYRRLPRPSSDPDAKASTMCPKKLQPKNTKTRCSRPLYNSQKTNHTTTSPTRTSHSRHHTKKTNPTPQKEGGARFLRTPTACPASHHNNPGLPHPPNPHPKTQDKRTGRQYQPKGRHSNQTE